MKPIGQLPKWYPVIAGETASMITGGIKISGTTCPIVIKAIGRWAIRK